MIITIRTDASSAIGTGHVMRCLTLAGVLREKGALVSFICREHDGHLCDLIEDRGFALHRLSKGADPAPPSSASHPYHAPWLGVSWEGDAAETAGFISSMPVKPDWLIVDQYALDERWEKQVRPFVHRIFFIDDLSDRVHDCDLLLDQNLVAGMEMRYDGKVPASCGRMLGPEYALLQPIYGELHDRIPTREGPVRRILIFFGGVDKSNLTSLALSAVIELNQSDLLIDVVLSERAPHYDTVRDLAAGHPGVVLHSGLPSLAPLMAKADLAIGAAGTTSWERLCLGLPAVVITTAENQQCVGEYLSKEGLIIFLGYKDQVDKKIFANTVEYIINSGKIFEYSLKCREITNGKGVYQITDLLIRKSKYCI